MGVGGGGGVWIWKGTRRNSKEKTKNTQQGGDEAHHEHTTRK
jgi:hypothetical protein